MNEDEVNYFKRKLSVNSERDLDSLSQIPNLDSSVNTILSSGMDRQPSHSSFGSRSKHGDGSPKRGEEYTSQWEVNVQPGEDGHENYTFSSESPVRKIRSKHISINEKDDQQPRPFLERQLTDTYLNSLSRTPRYERHNTYDEMADKLADDDPFKKEYKSSGKTKKHKKRKHRLADDASDPIPLQSHLSESTMSASSSSRKKGKKHKQPIPPSRESTNTYIVEGRNNPSYSQSDVLEEDDMRGESVQSNGTYTLRREGSSPELLRDKRKKKVVSTVITTSTTPVLRSPMRSQSVSQVIRRVSSRRRTKYGIDKVALAKFIQDRAVMQREALRTEADQDQHSGEQHSKLQKGKKIWHWKTHTKPIPCTSFGEIFFHGYGKDIETSPYIRVSVDTPASTVWDIMAHHWSLKPPGLLISVTGGAKHFDMIPKLRNRVKRGLMKAATSTGAWIVTGGSNAGVMEFVGEAFRDHVIANGRRDNIVVLGVATWGYVKNREVLEGSAEGCFPAIYSKEDVINLEKGGALDMNHTHFIFVDDGSENEHGKEIKFRADLESYIAKNVGMLTDSKINVNIPVIQMIIEGGINSLRTVYESVENNLPVLVLEGSGRAADLIANAYHMTENKITPDVSHFPSNFQEEMERLSEQLFDWRKDDKKKPAKIANCIHDLKAALKNRNMLNIIDIRETRSDFDKSLLFALLKAEKSNTNAQLSLALAWNRSDIAENEIFSYENKHNWQGMQLKDAMVTALIQDKRDFVKLFLENGLELTDFLDVKNLWNLYANCLTIQDSACQLLNSLINYLKQSWGAFLCCRPIVEQGCEPDLLKFVGKAIVYLVGDDSLNPYAESADLNFEVTGCQKELGYIEDDEIKDDTNKFSRSKIARKRWMMKYDFAIPSKELFIWAILLNRKELAYLFWKMVPNPLGAALLGSALLKALSDYAANEEIMELSNSLLENSQFFEGVAFDVLSECYKKDRAFSNQLLVRRLEIFGKTTLLTMADSCELMDFMGHPCCQSKLNTVWKGRMALYTSTLKILGCIAFPFLIPSIKFTSNEDLIDKIDLDQEEDFDDIEGIGMKHKVAPEPEKGSMTEKSKSKYLKKKLHKVTLIQNCAREEGDTISIPAAVYSFYTAPCTVFVCHTIAYLVFLALFSYFVLTDLYPITYPNSPSIYELIVWGWTLTMVIEEIRQLFARDQRSIRFKFTSWFDNIWNRFDLLMYLAFLLAFILRFVLSEDNFTWARIIYSITLTMYYIRIMHTFYVSKNIGPKVIMIKKMLTDLLFFFSILCVFVLSFGVLYHANLFPNAPATWRLLKGVLYIPYFQMYGELFLENMEGELPSPCSSNETEWRSGAAEQCPEKNALVLLMAAVYMILTNVLLINLLIAMFSHTFQKVQDNSEKVWKFHRYSLVYEYYDRPTIVPPFIILNHMFRGIRWILNHFFGIFSYHNDLKLRLDEKDNEKLNLFEKEAVEEYVHVRRQGEKEKMEKKVSTTAERIEKVIEELDNIKDQVSMGNMAKKDNKDELSSTTPVPDQTIMTSRSLKGPSIQDQIDQLSNYVQSEMKSMANAMKRMEAIITHQSLKSQQQTLDINHIHDDDDEDV